MKFKCFFALVAFAAATAFAQQQKYTITPTNGFGIISFTNKYSLGVNTLEGRLDKTWVPIENFFNTQLVGRVTLALPTNFTEFRVRHVSIAPGNAFKNLALVYGNLETVGGLGPIVPPGTNAWLTNFEGMNATSVPLSDPRSLVVDQAGNIYFSERDSHAVSVIDTNGQYFTAIGPLATFGTRRAGSIGFEPGAVADANQVSMRNPAGLFYSKERIYVLDSGNGRVLRYTNGLAGPTNGFVSVLLTDSNLLGQVFGATNGGGLWVRPDELEAYYTDGTMLKRWQAKNLFVTGGGVEIVPANFVDLATVTQSPDFKTIVVDRGDHRVWQVNSDGLKDPEAGTTFPFGRRIGKATSVSLAGPSSIFYLPVGGYLLGLDQGTSVWQVDAGDNAAEFVFGAPGVHAGDGEWFQKGRRDPKVSNVQSVVVAPSGDIVMIEGGFIRRIKFLRHKP